MENRLGRAYLKQWVLSAGYRVGRTVMHRREMIHQQLALHRRRRQPGWTPMPVPDWMDEASASGRVDVGGNAGNITGSRGHRRHPGLVGTGAQGIPVYCMRTACRQAEYRIWRRRQIGGRDGDWRGAGRGRGTARGAVRGAGRTASECDVVAIGLQQEQVYIANILKCRPLGTAIPAGGGVEM